jgi:hypothetical protein
VIRGLATASAALLGAWLSYALASCGPAPTSCIARGSSTTSEGTVTYSGTAHAQPAAKGTVGASVVVYDVTPGCWYPGIEFKVVVDSCSLWVKAPIEPGADEGEGGSDAGYVSAQVEPGATCDLPVSGGQVTVTGLSGALVVGSSISLALTGRLTATGDAEVSSPEDVSWSFVGK